MRYLTKITAGLCVAFSIQAKADGPMLAAGEYYLSSAQINAMRKLALRSNASSANRLSEYYSIYEDDREAGEFWLKVAAESGDCEAVIEIGYRYSSMSKKNDKQISYWRKRMADLRCKDEP